ncbi:Hypothetical protein FKW44_018498 [Caligus rogercresseyi]|uniref:Uncharacterized protein n=1 Tax=Caligus rogercresseyi TaxID=217165 RepID=A0A7T8GUW3_CALRO|nr:Hypothetical protein FKW44_018498 [Caligus rogercresseyi]
MYFNKFSHILFGLHYSLNLLMVEATQAGISSSDKDFHGPGTHNSQNDRVYLEKGRHPRAAEDSLQKAKATLSHGLS